MRNILPTKYIWLYKLKDSQIQILSNGLFCGNEKIDFQRAKSVEEYKWQIIKERLGI